MQTAPQFEQMDAEALRVFAAELMTEIVSIREENASIRQDNTFKQLRIDQLTHEMAVLKRLKFAARSEVLNAMQRQLFEETIDADVEATSLELALCRISARRSARGCHHESDPVSQAERP